MPARTEFYDFKFPYVLFSVTIFDAFNNLSSSNSSCSVKTLCNLELFLWFCNFTRRCLEANDCSEVTSLIWIYFSYISAFGKTCNTFWKFFDHLPASVEDLHSNNNHKHDTLPKWNLEGNYKSETHLCK